MIEKIFNDVHVEYKKIKLDNPNIIDYTFSVLIPIKSGLAYLIQVGYYSLVVIYMENTHVMEGIMLKFVDDE